MEKVLSKYQELEYKYLTIIILGLLTALLNQQIMIIALMIIMTYLYLKNEKSTYIYLLTFFMIFAIRNFLNAYYLSLFITLYLLFIQLLRLWNKNLQQWLPIVSGLIIAPFLYQEYQLKTFFISLFIAFFIYEIFNNKNNKQIILLLCIGLLCFYSHNSWLIALYIGYLCFKANLKISVSFIILSALFYQDLHMYYLSYFVIIAFKHHSYFYYMLASILLFHDDFIQALIFLLIISLFNYFFETKEYCEVKLNYEEQYLNRQLQCYSGIFDSLANYYRSDQPQASYVLKRLAKTLSDSTFHRIHQKEKDYIKATLESYYFQVLNVDVAKNWIKLEIKQIRKKDIEEMIVPLLHSILQKPYQVHYLQYHGNYFGYEIELSYDLEIRIEACGDSITNMLDSSGDIYSIFQFSDNYIIMIADGMGNGSKAYESAKLVSSLFQKFVVSGMYCEEAIKCINQLVQSECFSTLDVIFFNPSKQKAYLMKSAACPTYLIREDELHILEGNALPLGIVENVEIELQEVTIKENDLFLIVSDGVNENEIKKWSKKQRKLTLNQEKDCFYRLLNKEKRKDDTTFVFAKVLKNSTE